MKPFPFKLGARGQTAGQGGSAGFKMHPMSFDHIVVLAEIQSPWMAIALSTEPPETALLNALRNVKEEQ